jgi:hypothetical protein
VDNRLRQNLKVVANSKRQTTTQSDPKATADHDQIANPYSNLEPPPPSFLLSFLYIHLEANANAWKKD